MCFNRRLIFLRRFRPVSRREFSLEILFLVCVCRPTSLLGTRPIAARVWLPASSPPLLLVLLPKRFLNVLRLPASSSPPLPRTRCVVLLVLLPKRFRNALRLPTALGSTALGSGPRATLGGLVRRLGVACTPMSWMLVTGSLVTGSLVTGSLDALQTPARHAPHLRWVIKLVTVVPGTVTM